MGALVTVMVSPRLADGCDVAMDAAAALIADGWTAPAAKLQSTPDAGLYDSQMDTGTHPSAFIRAQSNGYYGEPHWEGLRKAPRIPSTGPLQAMHWSKRALAACIHRAAQDDAFESWTGAVEGAWWALALDDALENHLNRIYKEARDADADGRVVKGMRWLRNRHAHDILLTASGGAKKPFFVPPGGKGIFYISPSNRWMKSEDIIGNRPDRSASIRPDYDQHVAGMPLDMSLSHALRWFDTVFAASKFPDAPIPKDPTVLGAHE